MKCIMFIKLKECDIPNFIEVAKTFSFDIDLKCGRYTVNAKSVWGILSLDLSQPLFVAIPLTKNSLSVYDVFKKWEF